MTPRRLHPDDPALGDVQKLIHTAFAGMAAPAAALTGPELARMAAEGDGLVVVDGGTPVACLFTRPSRDLPGALYLGTLAVAKAYRGRGLARVLIDAGSDLARAKGLAGVTLDTGASLTHLHTLFGALGFRVVRRSGQVVTFLRPVPDPPTARLDPADRQAGAVLDLLYLVFRDMDGRVDPPNSLHRLTIAAIGAQARTGEAWIVGKPPVACLFLRPKLPVLGVGKLAVHPDWRHLGLARHLLDHADSRARHLGLTHLELQSRVELTGKHAVFTRLGFANVAETAHPGFNRATSVTFHRKVGPARPGT